ncbi:hypothetical protein [Streptobacillus moniliformis]|uniref:hypothetical protein n=1 Tax=Streptobacillus moniliformis TaxID=34105 RepID=UPI0007E30494|nr:hypothetical protein [Streptobacillus moniliformis]
MNKNCKNLVVCEKNKRKDIGMNILKNISEIHTIKDLTYPAKIIKIADNYFIFISSNNTEEENKFILYYTIEHFSKYDEDIIIDFKINKQNINTYKNVINLFKNKIIISNKIKKLLGDINEKF